MIYSDKMLKGKKFLLLSSLILLLIAAAGFFSWKYDVNFFRPAQPSFSEETGVSRPQGSSTPAEEDGAASRPSGSASAVNSLPGVRPYSGRDPEEVNPREAAVRIFSEQQRSGIYSRIRENGRAVKATPDFFYGWIELGLLKKIIGDYIGARDAWEYAGVLQPKNSLSFANLGELYWQYLPDFPKAEENLKISIRHKPEDTQTHVTLADLYHYSYEAKHDLAPQVLLDGLKSNPSNGTLMRRLAYLYEQREEWTNALLWWQKVLEQSPGDGEVIDKISKLREKIGSAAE